MLPHNERSPRPRAVLLFAAALAAVLPLAGRPARADEPAPVKESGGNATALVPADVSFFASFLRNKQQLDAVRNSNAYKKLMQLDIVKEGLKKAHADLDKDESPIPKIRAFFDQAENKPLLDLLKDAGSHEVFVYGGKGFTDLFSLLGHISNGMGTFQPGEDPGKWIGRGIAGVLQKHRKLLHAPELVFGFKLTDPKKADAQIARLEKLLHGLAKSAEGFKGKIARVAVAGDSFLTLAFDGEMLPWDMIPVKAIEDKEGEYEDLVKHVKSLKLTLSVGVRNGYLLLAITPTAKDLEKFAGAGKHLADRDELKPLARYASKPLASIGYLSKALNVKLSGGPADLRTAAKQIKGMLAMAPIPEEKVKAIGKDLEGLFEDLAKYMPEVGARFGFTFLTDTGYEGYSYDYGKHDDLKGAKLKLKNHLGGDPIFAAARGSNSDGTAYPTIVKWVKKIYGHVEDNLDDDTKKSIKPFYPLLQRFDETTTKLFLPAVKDCSVGVVVDAKWKSKRWHKEMPELPAAVPLPEVGFLLSLADAEKFTKSLKDYRLTVNEIIEKLGDTVGKDNVPEFKIPVAETEKGKHGSLYYYKLPEEWGLDKQIAPTVGVGKHVAVLAPSRKFADRLLGNHPLAVKSGPIVEHKNAIGITYLNFPALMDAAIPWVDAIPAIEGSSDKADAAKTDAVKKQVKTALELLKVFQGFSSATYLDEAGVLVTHHQTTFKDR
jgi:hypothetical protein